MPAYNPGTGFRRGNRRFGRQVHPITKKVTGHAGDDWPAPEGTPIPAAYAGEVKEIRNQFNPANGTGWGWYVLLEHSVRGQVVKTRYAHMRQRSPLQVGDKVVKGQVIGEAGSTGGSTGPHLHFEVIVNNTPVDPSTFDFPDDDVRNDGDWAYPFQPLQVEGSEGQAQEVKTPLSVRYYESLANAESGAYPIGSNGIWHGGLHFDRATAVMLNQDVGVRCLAGGEVVAYRVDGKYPASSYATGDAEYSTGFVLVRHKLQLPAAPRAVGGDNAAQGTGLQSEDASVKEDTEDSQGQKETLHFYSLYMHLAKADDYEGQERQRPSYWETADNKYRVASRAVDANPYDRNDPRKGIRVRRGRGSRTQCIGWLPPGTAIVVEGGNGAWRKISSFEEGSMVAAPDDAPAQDAPKGWVYIGELDKVTISHPAAIDMVHIPEVPVTLKAGDFVGYLGQYKRRRDAGPFCSSRPIVHLEVFTGDDLDAFIAKSRLRAAELPDSSHTMLLIEEGAQLAMPSEPDQTIAATEAVMVEGAGADVTWVQVRRGNVQILPRIGLGSYSGDATRVYGGRYHLLRIMDNAGNSIELEQFNALSREAKTGYPNREVFLVGDEKLWVKRDALGGRHVVSGHELKAWSRFPMQTSDTSGPKVSVPRVLAVAELGKPETEPDGPRWWQVEVGTEKGSSASGWACEKGQAKVRLCSPWDWPGFDITRESTPTKDMHEHSLDVNGEVRPGESFKATADQVDGSALFRKLRNAMDLDGKDGISRDELRSALRRPWLAQAISRLIVHYESEWGGEMSKWSALDPHMQGELATDWVVEKQRIEKLRWWQHIAGKHDFPSDPNVFHIHPIALVTNFHGQVMSGCYCHRDMTEDEIREIVLAMRKSEGPVYDRVGDRLFTENNVSLPETDKTYARLTDELNTAFNAYGIDTCIRRLHFLAQAYWESDRFRTTKEYGSGHRYAPYDGRGLMQLTWRRAYEMYESQTGTSCVQAPDNISNSLHHSVDSAAWYWRQGKELSAGDRWSAPSSAPDYVRRHNPAYPKTTQSYVYDGESRRYGTVDLSLIADDDYVDVISWLVNGGSNGLAERRVYVQRLKEIMKYDQCANRKGS